MICLIQTCVRVVNKLKYRPDINPDSEPDTKPDEGDYLEDITLPKV